jgi:cytochrome P450 family 4
MLDLLLLAEKKGQIDEEGIKEEIDTFTFEAHDTTGMALAFTLMLLAENKDVQQTARQEVRDLFRAKGGQLNSTDLQDLNYVERCIKESLRLYPSVPTIMRYLKEDLQLRNYTVPAGTSVVCFIKEVHHDPNFWPEPEKFDPDRFLPERSVNRHPYAYLPFSAGPRNCIGQKFAMMELKALVAKILLAFELEPVDRLADVRFKMDMVIRPAHPIHLKFVQINKN